MSMNRLRHTSRYLLIALLMAACEKEPMPIIPSSVPISFDVSHEGMKGNTRASIFGDENSTVTDFLDDPIKHPNDFLDAAKGGGNYTLLAYIDGKQDAGGAALQYLNARVWWQKDIALEEQKKAESVRDFNKAWKFLEGDEQTGHTYEVYWPKNEKLNFFAYMPYSGHAMYTNNTDGYSVTNINYSENVGVSFSCTMPAISENGDTPQEFIYAHVTERTSSGGEVPLHFSHPFAVMRFKLAMGSYRLNIDNIKFNGIKLAGSYTSNAVTSPSTLALDSWSTASSTATSQTYTINKKIPAEINYNAIFGGPFLVIPQSIGGITMDITAQRIDSNQEKYNRTGISISTTEVSQWEPGKVYTYTLKIGDGYEEILYDVKVEPWIAEGKTITEIE